MVLKVSVPNYTTFGKDTDLSSTLLSPEGRLFFTSLAPFRNYGDFALQSGQISDFLTRCKNHGRGGRNV